MGGIRKKTSKRGTTFQASKIHKKASETRKKNARSKKKDVTWKSKKTKDPGIPNNFPYKDQVLAEMAAQKLADEEAKLARRAANRLAFSSNPNPNLDPDSDDENPGILSLHNRRAVNLPTTTTSPAIPIASTSSSAPPPQLVDSEIPTTQAAIERAQIIIHLLDARSPLPHRSAFLESLIAEGKGSDKYLIILNKIDLIPREAGAAWLRLLRAEIPNGGKEGDVRVLAVKSSVKTAKGEGKGGEGVAWGREEVLEVLKGWEGEIRKAGKEEVVACVVGLPNVGKSAFINTLLSTPTLPTAPLTPSTSSSGNSTTTLTPIELSLPLSSGEAGIKIIDTPGFEFQAPEFPEEDEEDEDMDGEADEEEEEEKERKWDLLEETVARDMLIRNLGRVEKIKDPYPLVKWIIDNSINQDLMMAYNVPAFKEGDMMTFLTSLARASGRIKKFGVADTDSAARVLLRDWSHNLFPKYTMPAASVLAALGECTPTVGDETVLGGMRTKKEMRKEGRGLVRMVVGEVDGRELILDEEYQPATIPGMDSDDEDDEDQDGDLEMEVMEDDEFSEGDEEEEGEGDDDEEDPEELIWDGEGDEVVLSDDEIPVPTSDEDDEEEEEDEPTPPPTKSSKRKRQSDPAPPHPSKKPKSVAFPSKLEAPKSVKGKDAVKPSSILKRKNRDDDIDMDVEVERPARGKKARRAEREEEVEIEVTEVKVPKGPQAPKKSAKQMKKEAEAKAAGANGVAAKEVNGGKKEGKKVQTKVVVPGVPIVKQVQLEEGEKAYDFAAHFF